MKYNHLNCLFFLLLLFVACERVNNEKNIKRIAKKPQISFLKKELTNEKIITQTYLTTPKIVAKTNATSADFDKINDKIKLRKITDDLLDNWFSNGYPSAILSNDNGKEFLKDALEKGLSIVQLCSLIEMVPCSMNTNASFSFLESLLKECKTDTEKYHVYNLIAETHLFSTDPQMLDERDIYMSKEALQHIEEAKKLISNIIKFTENQEVYSSQLGYKARELMVICQNNSENTIEEEKSARNLLDYSKKSKKYNSMAALFYIKALMNNKKYKQALKEIKKSNLLNSSWDDYYTKRLSIAISTKTIIPHERIYFGGWDSNDL